MNYQNVPKPKKRSELRKKLGRQYFISKRRLSWMLAFGNIAKHREDTSLSHSVITHKSLLLRKLKDVDMYLQHNKVENLKLATDRMNGVIIKPGQSFSLWSLVGEPTKRKGYKVGLALHNGKIGTDIGGGLCQLGNLIYWMALHSPLEVKERWRHGYDVFPDVNRKIPFGCGATLAYNYIDLQLQNNTTNTYQLKFDVGSTHLHGSLLCNKPQVTGYEVYEADHVFKHQWWGGYTRHNRIFRKITSPFGDERHELVTENHAIMMYSPLLHPSVGV